MLPNVLESPKSPKSPKTIDFYWVHEIMTRAICTLDWGTGGCMNSVVLGTPHFVAFIMFRRSGHYRSIANLPLISSDISPVFQANVSSLRIFGNGSVTSNHRWARLITDWSEVMMARFTFKSVWGQSCYSLSRKCLSSFLNDYGRLLLFCWRRLGAPWVISHNQNKDQL